MCFEPVPARRRAYCSDACRRRSKAMRNTAADKAARRAARPKHAREACNQLAEMAEKVRLRRGQCSVCVEPSDTLDTTTRTCGNADCVTRRIEVDAARLSEAVALCGVCDRPLTDEAIHTKHNAPRTCGISECINEANRLRQRHQRDTDEYRAQAAAYARRPDRREAAREYSARYDADPVNRARKAELAVKQRAARFAQEIDPDDPRHGTDNLYVNYGCRCDECTEAHSAYISEWRSRSESKSEPGKETT